MPVRSPLRRIGFAAAALSLPLFVLELVLQVLARVFAPPLHVPEGAEVQAPRPDALRIVGVGDSWMWGAESPPEAAFLRVAAEAVENEGGIPVQIWNLGAPGSNSAQALLRLSEIVDGVQPHVVVALTGSNDVLHDTGADAVASLLGRDPRLFAGPALLDRSRVVRLGRLFALNFGLPSRAPAAAPQDLPPLPPPPAAEALQVLLPWWNHVVLRRWEDALWVLRATPPPTPELAGVAKAWEALLLARMGSETEAEVAAAEARRLGGDEATLWEARAILADRRDEGLFAFFCRSRAATAEGHPFIRTRARGLVLVELERWELAQEALLAANGAVPGDLEALLGLARIPEAARSEAVEAALYAGPRGIVLPEEYMLWHLRTSGDVERAIGSLSEPDAREPAPLRLARARAYELLGRLDEAAMAYEDIRIDAATPPIDAERAAAGLLRVVPLDEEAALRERLAQLEPTPRVAPALAARLVRLDDCPAALAVGVRGLAQGLSPRVFEDALGACLDSSVGWSLTTAAWAAGPPLAWDAWSAALPSDRLPNSVPPPSAAGWTAARLDGTEGGAMDSGAFLALLLADGSRPFEARVRLHATAPDLDESTWHLADAFIAEAEGRGATALVAYERAAAAPGDPWSRAFARAAAAILTGRGSLSTLAPIERGSPGLAAVERLVRRVPESSRPPWARRLLDFGPSGRVLPGARAVGALLNAQVDAARLLAADAARTPAQSDGLLLAVARALVGAPDGNPGGAVPVDDGDARCAEAIARAVTTGLRDPACKLPIVALAGLHHGTVAIAEAVAREALEAGAAPIDVLRFRPDLGADRVASFAEEVGTSPVLLAALEPATEEGADTLAEHLDAMARMTRSAGGQFVALTYPFPSGHHQQVRERILAAGEHGGFDTLDLYEDFESRLSAEAWAALRTPQDHVDASGYARMGEVLAAWIRTATARSLPAPPPATSP